MPPVICGYSLWLIPEPPLSRALAGCINLLADHYQGPRFAPHITLLGQIQKNQSEVLKAAAALAGLLPLHLKASGGGFSPSWFKAIFIDVHPDGTLTEARLLAGRLLGCRPAPYRPHLSLFYGKLPLSTKRQAFSSLGLRLPAEVCIRRLAVMRTEGEVSRWRRAAEFRCGPRAA